ncbi:MAG: FtsW/RodA/SpoVE family cell cycle protein [candidate division WOR-3 bacterium]
MATNPYLQIYHDSSIKNRLQRQLTSIDLPLLITAIILTMVGLVMIYSITLYSGNAYFIKQTVRVLVGLFALIIAVNVPHSIYQGKLRHILLIFTIIMLILTLTVGKQVAAVKRWAYFFQPAEIAKYVLIIWLAGYFKNQQEQKIKQTQNPKSFFSGFPLIPLAVAAIIIILLLLQPAIGTSFILTLTTLFILFVGGVKFKHLLLISLAGLSLIVVTIITVPYAKKRFVEFRNGITYQQKQSRIAIGSGHIWGKGLGEGKQKFYFLPKLHTDFIFSAIAEEFGLLGSLFVLTIFFIMFTRGISIAFATNDLFSKVLAFGITIVLIQYVMVHLAVALALIPTTGQPLPFISYGGSALVTNLYAIGIILNISRFRRKHYGQNFNRNWRHGRTYLPGARSW